MDTIDPQVKTLVQAIGKAETGGQTDPYTTKGASGEFGAYQFMPDTWKMWAKESLGNENAPMTMENQNRVAYNKVKQWKDSGLTPAQIASKWNSGDENAYKTQTPGKNSAGVDFDTPGYTAKVSNYYRQLSGSTTSPTTPVSPETQGTQTATQPQPMPKSPDLLEKVGGWVNAIFPGKEVGDLIGSLYDKLTLPPEQAKLVELPHPLSVLADAAQAGLMIGGIPGIGAGGSALAKVGIAGVESAAYGGLNAVAGGSRDIKDIGTQAAIGGGLGLATGGLLAGGSKILSSLGGKTAEEIAMVAEKDVKKLPLREQEQWYKQKSKSIQETSTNLSSKAKELGTQATEQATKEINDFNQTIGKSSRETAIDLKPKAQQVMKDASQEYIALTGEAADSAGSALNKTLTHEDLASKIDSKFEYNPEIATSLKSDLGLKTLEQKMGEDGLPIIETTPKVEKITNQEILDKAREIMRTVSKISKSGGKVYSPAEYEVMKKYSFLMETLGENGVDMTAANKFWKSYVPVRDRIVREIKPFDETDVGKMPFSSTIQKAEGTAKTSLQVASKLDAQNFIKELETRMKLPKGTIGADIRDAVSGLEKAKLNKENIEKVTKETLNQIKADKTEALKTISTNKYNTEKSARTRAIIKKVILVTLGLSALETPVGKAVVHGAIGL